MKRMLAPEERLVASDVKDARTFTLFAQQQLGCRLPEGSAARGRWYKELGWKARRFEWTWDDLMQTVLYAKRRHIHVRDVADLLQYVRAAKLARDEDEITELQAKVAEAIYKEEDEAWRRRLSLARGKALEMVYRQWRMERVMKG